MGINMLQKSTKPHLFFGSFNVVKNEKPVDALSKNRRYSSEKWQFLTLILKLMEAKRTIEVGIFEGHESIWTADALPANGQAIMCDVGNEWANITFEAQENAGKTRFAKHFVGAAIPTLQNLIAEGQKNTFDFAFIDADKPNYPSYYQYCVELVRPGGLVAIDNVLSEGKMQDDFDFSADTIAIQAIKRMVYADARVEASTLPLGTGVLLARKLGL
jgi:predicted O-methyltransferase YrrM